MKEIDDALLKIQIALENDAEVTTARIENIEGTCDRIAKHYAGMLNYTDQTEQNAQMLVDSKERLQGLLQQLSRVEQRVNQYSQLAEEISLWTTELEGKVLASSSSSKK